MCPNFIEAYSYDNKLNLLIMEYADGDSKFLFKNVYYDTDIYKSYICQTLLSLYVFTNYTMLYHCDLKPGNILYKKINPNLIFHYKIDKSDFYIPTYGHLFMLADYGSAKFALGDRLTDLKNFSYKIITNILRSFYKDGFKCNMISNHDVDNVINYLKNNDDLKRKIIIDKITDSINYIKKNTNSKINNYVFELSNILSYSENIPDILNTFFVDFTKKDIYKDKIIIDFSFNLS
jgi:thiamine kinase-like enzyme